MGGFVHFVAYQGHHGTTGSVSSQVVEPGLQKKSERQIKISFNNNATLACRENNTDSECKHRDFIIPGRLVET